MTLEAIALSKAEAADALSVSSRTISYLIADGTLVARKLGARTLIDVESLRAYRASLPRGAGAPLPCSRRAANPTFPTGRLILEFCRKNLNRVKGR